MITSSLYNSNLVLTNGSKPLSRRLPPTVSISIQTRRCCNHLFSVYTLAYTPASLSVEAAWKNLKLDESISKILLPKAAQYCCGTTRVSARWRSRPPDRCIAGYSWAHNSMQLENRNFRMQAAYSPWPHRRSPFLRTRPRLFCVKAPSIQLRLPLNSLCLNQFIHFRFSDHGIGIAHFSFSSH